MIERSFTNPSLANIISAVFSLKEKRFQRAAFMSHLSLYLALLMQFAHPLVAEAGVNHSYAGKDFWGRARRTLFLTEKLLGCTTDGERKKAAEVINQIHSAHAKRGVKGPTDPEALEWVWSTVVFANITAHQKFVGVLSDGQLIQYLTHSKKCAALINVVTECSTWTELNKHIYDMIKQSRVAVNDDSRKLAEELYLSHRNTPIVGPLANFGFQIAASMLPDLLRSQYNFPWLRPLDDKLMKPTQMFWRFVIPLMTTKLAGID